VSEKKRFESTPAFADSFPASSDSTNGHSWCYTPYNDNTPGMAISYKTMVNAAGGDEMAARKMFCGLEAEVTTPEGRTATLYVGEFSRCRTLSSRLSETFSTRSSPLHFSFRSR
jgi:hypothetical protein